MAALGQQLADLPEPSHDLNAYWQIAKCYPVEWRQIVNKYFTYHDDDTKRSKKRKRDAEHLVQADDGAEACQSDAAHKCDICNVVFRSHKQLAVHRWSKHKLKAGVRNFLGDVSVCPICRTDFRSRIRLVKHMSERRVRAKNRPTTCQQVFLSSNPAPVPDVELQRLEARDKTRSKEVRKSGHSHELAAVPSVRTVPHILKKPRVKPQQSCDTGSHSFVGHLWQPRRRLRGKTPAGASTTDDNSLRPLKRLRCKTPQAMACLVHKTRA